MFPPLLLRFSHLVEVNLAGNHLDSVPPQISCLSALCVLDLRGNNITELPTQIGRLEQLRELNLSQNKLVSLPVSIVMLVGLTDVDLSANQISSQATLQPLAYLPHLDRLNVGDNPFLEADGGSRAWKRADPKSAVTALRAAFGSDKEVKQRKSLPFNVSSGCTAGTGF